jgi:hypothetical protein
MAVARDASSEFIPDVEKRQRRDELATVEVDDVIETAKPFGMCHQILRDCTPAFRETDDAGTIRDGMIREDATEINHRLPGSRRSEDGQMHRLE